MTIQLNLIALERMIRIMRSWLHCVGAPGFEHVDGQKAERAFRVTIAKEGVWNIGAILQGLACSILSRIIAAIG